MENFTKNTHIALVGDINDAVLIGLNMIRGFD
jgi:hypothetical protein